MQDAPWEDEGIGVRAQILVQEPVPLREYYAVAPEVPAPDEDAAEQVSPHNSFVVSQIVHHDHDLR